MTMNPCESSVIPGNPAHNRKAHVQKTKLRVVVYFRVGKEPEEPPPVYQALMELHTSSRESNLNFILSDAYASKSTPEISFKKGESISRIFEGCRASRADRALTRSSASLQQKYRDTGSRPGRIQVHRWQHRKGYI